MTSAPSRSISVPGTAPASMMSTTIRASSRTAAAAAPRPTVPPSSSPNRCRIRQPGGAEPGGAERTRNPPPGPRSRAHPALVAWIRLPQTEHDEARRVSLESEKRDTRSWKCRAGRGDAVTETSGCGSWKAGRRRAPPRRPPRPKVDQQNLQQNLWIRGASRRPFGAGHSATATVTVPSMPRGGPVSHRPPRGVTWLFPGINSTGLFGRCRATGDPSASIVRPGLSSVAGEDRGEDAAPLLLVDQDRE